MSSPVVPKAAAADEPAARVLRQFRIVINAVKSHFRQVESQVGTSGAQVWALHLIRERPGIGVSDLARAMDVRQPTASGLVKALVDQGLIEARREGSDRRVVQLHATTEGRGVLRHAPGPFAGVLPQALAELDARTLRRLEQDLGTLIQKLGADDRAGTIPLGDSVG